MADEEEIRAVRGHRCSGLDEHYNFATSACIPEFGMNGSLIGCDDTNRILIRYCPYCGERLREPREDELEIIE